MVSFLHLQQEEVSVVYQSRPKVRMVVQYLVQNSNKLAFLPRDETEKSRIATASAFLSSFIADADLFTDWMYYLEIVRRSEDEVHINGSIRRLQIASCLCGTAAWFAIGSDGRLVDWIRRVSWFIVWACYSVAELILYWFPRVIIFCIFCGCINENNDRYYKGIKDNMRKKLNEYFQHGFDVSSGFLLMLGIIAEDLPQIIVTFLVEDASGSPENEGISNGAYLNLIVAIFDILHKLAAAWDDRNLFVNTGSGIRTCTGHDGDVWSLAVVGKDKIVSASCDGNGILWDIRGKKAKPVNTVDLREHIFQGTIAKLNDGNIVATSSDPDGKIQVFNLKTGDCIDSIDHGYNAECTVVSNRGNYVLTSKRAGDDSTVDENNDSVFNVFNPTRTNGNGNRSQGKITKWRWDGNKLKLETVYPHRADSIVIIGDDRFVSANETSQEEGNPILWDVKSGSRNRKFKIAKEGSKVTAMSKCDDSSFLVASVHGDDTTVDMFDVGGEDPKTSMTIKGSKVKYLVSVGVDRFVSCNKESSEAILWDISSGVNLHTFRGHDEWIRDLVFLRGQHKIATASADRTVKVWPIPRLKEARKYGHDTAPGDNDIESQGVSLGFGRWKLEDQRSEHG